MPSTRAEASSETAGAAVPKEMDSEPAVAPRASTAASVLLSTARKPGLDPEVTRPLASTTTDE